VGSGSDRLGSICLHPHVNRWCIADGYGATVIIRSRGLTVPIIALTGNALDEDQRKFLEAGADDVLTKPVRKDQLDAILRRFTHFGQQ